MSTLLITDKQQMELVLPVWQRGGETNSSWGKQTAQSSQILISQEQRQEIQGNNTLGIKQCQPPVLQIQIILKQPEFLVTIHFQLTGCCYLDIQTPKECNRNIKKKPVCTRVIFCHLRHSKALQHLIQDVLPVITLQPQSKNKARKQLTAGSGIQQEKGTPHFSRLLLSLLQSK